MLKNRTERSPPHDALYEAYLLATIFGVTGAWIGLLFIWKQSRSIEGQLSEMQEASRQTVALITQVSAGATASRLAAEAAINTERPWLVVSWEHDIKKAGSFLFGCLNQGRTPAKVISVSAKACFVKDQYALPIPPDYSTPAEPPRLNLIVNKDSFPIEKGVNAEAYIASNGKEDLTHRSEEWLYYYGNVVYRDTLYPDSAKEGLHETRWCFFWQPFKKEFLRGGPKEYNSYS